MNLWEIDTYGWCHTNWLFELKQNKLHISVGNGTKKFQTIHFDYFKGCFTAHFHPEQEIFCKFWQIIVHCVLKKSQI